MDITIFSKLNKNLPWIKDKTMFLTLHGSRAYGTDIETSDSDYKGICCPPKEYFFGTHKFEQAELKDPDTVIFEIRKFFNLAAASNPNCLEILFTDPSSHVFVDSFGQTLIDNREKFLSKRIKFTMMGYAFAQFKRIRLHRGYLLNPPRNYPTRKEMGLPEQTLIPRDQMLAASAEIQKELDRLNFDFMEGLAEPVKIAIRSSMTDLLAQYKITSEDQWMGAARKVGLNDNFIQIMQKERAYNSKKIEFDQYQNWKQNRNKDRAKMEEKFGFDGKHALHLVRLTRMCYEVLTTSKMNVRRDDREELLAIRNGNWTYEQLEEYFANQEKLIAEAYTNCTFLPQTPNSKYLDQLCIDLVQQSLDKYSWYNIKRWFVK